MCRKRIKKRGEGGPKKIRGDYRRTDKIYEEEKKTTSTKKKLREERLLKKKSTRESVA